MKKSLLFIIAVLFLQTAFADPVPPRLMRNMRGQPVMRASLQKGALKLVTTYQRVSLENYQNVIVKGACSILLADHEKGWEKAWIDQIDVLSKNERQGYTFWDARQSCFRLDKIKEEEKRQHFFTQQTRICETGICPRQEKNSKKTK